MIKYKDIPDSFVFQNLTKTIKNKLPENYSRDGVDVILTDYKKQTIETRYYIRNFVKKNRGKLKMLDILFILSEELNLVEGTIEGIIYKYNYV